MVVAVDDSLLKRKRALRISAFHKDSSYLQHFTQLHIIFPMHYTAQHMVPNTPCCGHFCMMLPGELMVNQLLHIKTQNMNGSNCHVTPNKINHLYSSFPGLLLFPSCFV